MISCFLQSFVGRKCVLLFVFNLPLFAISFHFFSYSMLITNCFIASLQSLELFPGRILVHAVLRRVSRPHARICGPTGRILGYAVQRCVSRLHILGYVVMRRVVSRQHNRKCDPNA